MNNTIATCVWPGVAHAPRFLPRFAIGALATLVLAACASSPNDPTGVISITVKPGDTGTCESTPCQVNLVMPPGQGNFEVTGNEVKVGSFPAGQTVNLGGYWQSQKFAIVGAGVPPAYVYITAPQ